jgi:4-diphosphocytidyl-2-C-methyl-D-erythritol kinase
MVAPEVTALAPAKINLALRVGARRPDGYHPLISLFHAVDLMERVTVRAASSVVQSDPFAPNSSGDQTGQSGFANSGDWAGCRASLDELVVTGRDAAAVPLDSSNLVLRAADLLRRECGWRAPVRFEIAKAIPVAGGLAGGSADGAAALVALNAHWGLGLSRSRLIELAAELGSDVPFSVLGGNAIGRGRGEALSPVPAAATAPLVLDWVLITSAAGLSTPAVFARFDALESPCPQGHEARDPAHFSKLRPPTDPTAPPPIPPALLEGLSSCNRQLIGAHLVNDLQPAAFSLRPDLAGLVRAALEAGALGAIVSGSGPTVAALAESADHAASLVRSFSRTLARPIAARSIQLLRASGPAPGSQVEE